jgi:hypothetical protein
MSRTHDVTISAFDLDRLESELTAVTEQRDRLAEALELLVTTDHESKEAFIERVKHALAAVKGGSDDN